MRPSLPALAGLAMAALAGCEMPNATDETGLLRNISPQALAALPSGIDPRFLIRDGNGCYGVALEVTEPPSGIALMDAAGQPVCDA